MKRGHLRARALVALGILFAVAALLLLLVAIWTVGDDSGRWAGTAVVAACLGMLCGWGAWWVWPEEAS